jgi:hypothetical protein
MHFSTKFLEPLAAVALQFNISGPNAKAGRALYRNMCKLRLHMQWNGLSDDMPSFT